MALLAGSPPVDAGVTRDTGWIPGPAGSPGGRHGSPLQYACLESPLYRGAWWATVHSVAKSRTWLKRLSTHAGKERASLCEKGGVIKGPWWEESLIASSRMLPSQGGLLWSITSTQGPAAGKWSFTSLTLEPKLTPQTWAHHLCVMKNLLLFKDSHTQPLSPACVQCVSWRPNRTGQKRRGRKQNDGDGYPFSGTTSDAKQRFCRGPGQGPGTDAEPYLKTTVRCLYLFGSADCGGRGHHSGAVGVSATPSRDPKPIGMNSPLFGQHLALEQNQPRASPQRAGCLFLRGATGRGVQAGKSSG